MVRKRKRKTIRRPESFWRDAVEQWEGSGLSIARYCRREGLALSTFTLWKRRLASDGRSSLIPVEVVIDDQGMSNVPFEVVLRSGHVVRVPPGFDDASLSRLVAILETGGC